MADVMPDYQLESQRLRATIAQLLWNIEKGKLEILEVANRKKRAIENIAATEKAIKEMKEKLKGLIKTHGDAATGTEGENENG